MNHQKKKEFEGGIDRKSPKIRDLNCKIFGSWNEIDSYFEEHKSIRPDTQMLIIQIAHGAPLGKAQCDGGVFSGRETIEYLKKYSEQRKVAFLSGSCYSGDLIRELLLNDQSRTKDDPTLKHLCIGTSSVFGQNVQGIDKEAFIWPKALASVKVGGNVEDLYRLVDRNHGGMISSAAWEILGLAEFFETKEIDKGLKALERINTILQGASDQLRCSDQVGHQLVQTCLHPKVNDANFDVFATLSKYSTIESKRLLGLDKDIQKNRNLLEKVKHENNARSAALLEAVIKCEVSYVEFFGDFVKSEANKERISTDQLIQSVQKFRESNRRPKECDQAREYYSYVPAELDCFAGEFSGWPVNEYLISKKKALQLLNSSNDLRPMAEIFGESAEACHDSSKELAEGKQQIIDDLFGVFDRTQPKKPAHDEHDEFMDRLPTNDEIEAYDRAMRIFEGKTGKKNDREAYIAMLRGFNLASIEAHRLEDERDRLRREACRNFVFE